MEMRLKKCLLILLALLCCLGVFGFAACQSDKAEDVKYDSAKNEYGVKYQSQCVAEPDENVSIDGVLDDSIWQNKKWFSSTFVANTTGTLPVLRVTGSLTDKGIYIATVLEDDNLVYNGYFNPHQCTSLEYYLCVYTVGEERTDSYVNRPHFYIDLGNNLYSTGMNMMHAVKYDGELNSGETTRAVFEMFIPWEETGIDMTKGVPTEFYFLPNSRHVLRGATGTSILKGVQNFMQHPLNLYVFDKDGYTDEDKEDAVLGDAKNGYAKTGNWDVSEEDPNTVKIFDGEEYNSIFFRSAYSTYNVAEVTLYPEGGSAVYSGHFGGLYYLNSDGNHYAAMLNFSDSYLVDGANGTKTVNNYQIITLDNYVKSWNQVSKKTGKNDSTSTDNGIKLKIVKFRDQLHYFVNDEYYYSETVSFLTGDTFVGLYSLNMHMTYADCAYTELTETSARTLLESDGIYTVNAEVVTRGGSVYCLTDYVVSGQDATIEFVSDNGYELSKVEKDGVDITADVIANAAEGRYVIENVTKSSDVKVSYKALQNAVNYTGYLTVDGQSVDATMSLVNLANQANKYSLGATKQSGFTAKVPAGEYLVVTSREGDKYVSAGKVTINADTNENYEIGAEYILKTNMKFEQGRLISAVDTYVNGATYSLVNKELHGDFKVSADFKTVEQNWSSIGFTIIDSNNNSIQIMLGGTSIIRVLANYCWNENDGGINRIEKGVSSFAVNNNSLECGMSVVYDSVKKVFNVYINEAPATKITIEEIAAKFTKNCKGTFGEGDVFTVGTSAWVVEPMTGRTSAEPLMSVTNLTAEEIELLDTVELVFDKAGTKTLDASVLGGENATWTSSNEKVATVDQNGVLNALSIGTALITAKTASGKTAYWSITCRDPYNNVNQGSHTYDFATGEACITGLFYASDNDGQNNNVAYYNLNNINKLADNFAVEFYAKSTLGDNNYGYTIKIMTSGNNRGTAMNYKWFNTRADYWVAGNWGGARKDPATNNNQYNIGIDGYNKVRLERYVDRDADTISYKITIWSKDGSEYKVVELSDVINDKSNPDYTYAIGFAVSRIGNDGNKYIYVKDFTYTALD